MKTVILCGGLGTRLGEETTLRPKPMIEIGGHPILCHIMNIYSHFGFKDFTLALGYKASFIKEYFLNFHALRSDFEIDLKKGEVDILRKQHIDWKVSLIDTGLATLTGGRLLRLKKYLEGEESFMLTYGDGVANINLHELLKLHRKHGKIATVSAVRPPSRFGEILVNGEMVSRFAEKPQTEAGWINGGFFIFEKEIFSYLSNDETILERDPLERLAEEGQLSVYKHDGFWQCMDTLRDKKFLDELALREDAPWPLFS